jgi:hypothetical protein
MLTCERLHVSAKNLAILRTYTEHFRQNKEDICVCIAIHHLKLPEMFFVRPEDG